MKKEKATRGRRPVGDKTAVKQRIVSLTEDDMKNLGKIEEYYRRKMGNGEIKLSRISILRALLRAEIKRLGLSDPEGA